DGVRVGKAHISQRPSNGHGRLSKEEVVSFWDKDSGLSMLSHDHSSDESGSDSQMRKRYTEYTTKPSEGCFQELLKEVKEMKHQYAYAASEVKEMKLQYACLASSVKRLEQINIHSNIPH
ncbi:hypothetical protein BGX20_007031, partial [Mortierella sp. AD010]